MSKRTNLNALLFMLVFLPAMVGTTLAEPLFPLDVGLQYEYKRWDSADPDNKWTVLFKITSQVTIGSLDYFQLQIWNYDNDSAYEDGGYLRSTEEALYGYNPNGVDYLEFQAAPVGTKWSFYQEHGGLDYKFIEIVAIEQVTVPYGTFNEAYNHRRYRCANLDGTGDKSPYWYEWIVPGVGMVKEVDYWTDNPPAIMELVSVTSVDIERISMCSQMDHLDGIAVSVPWRFEARIDFVDTGSLANIDMTLPGGSTTYPLDNENGSWGYESWPTLYPTLTALQAIYPTGLYTFDFRDSSGSLIKSVQLDYSGIDEPGSPVDFTYPSDDGQTGISTNPTLTWTVNSGAGDALGGGLQDDYGEFYGLDGLDAWPVPMETLSWQPGPLDPEQNYWLYVTVVRVKDWAGGPGLPTKNMDGDEFEYGLHIGYMNKIGFTTGPTVEEALDIDMIHIETECEHVDGSLKGAYPWDFEIEVSVSDPGLLHHIDVIKPGDTTSSHTFFEEEPGLWTFDPSKDSSLEDLRADYPEGTYTLEFRDSGNTLLKTVPLDYSGLSAPASVVDFTYPSVNGQTGVSANPTFEWTIEADAGDVLALGVDDAAGEPVYVALPVSMTTLSWSPGLLLPSHEYELNVSVSRVKDWVGPGMPTMTVGSDEFAYILVFCYHNEITFTISPNCDFCGPPGSSEPDGYVDYWDLLYFAQRWHTDPSDTNWDPRCDLDKEDNYVDYWDLLVFAQQWHTGAKP